jgi:hypothetical protein
MFQFDVGRPTFAKNFSFVFPEIMYDPPVPPLHEGRTRRHGRWGRDAVDVSEPLDEWLSTRTVKSCGPGVPALTPCGNAFTHCARGQ